MATTTIRVDTDTHERLVEISKVTGESLIDTVRAATEALRRAQFASRVTAELNELRQDEGAWQGYLAEAERTAVSDGIS